METLERVLSEHPFLNDFPDRHLELVVGCASNVRLEAGQFIFHEGEEANTFYLIRQGKVALQIFSERRGPLTILTLGEGEILDGRGCSHLTDGSFRHEPSSRRVFLLSTGSACAPKLNKTTNSVTNS